MEGGSVQGREGRVVVQVNGGESASIYSCMCMLENSSSLKISPSHLSTSLLVKEPGSKNHNRCVGLSGQPSVCSALCACMHTHPHTQTHTRTHACTHALTHCLTHSLTHRSLVGKWFCALCCLCKCVPYLCRGSVIGPTFQFDVPMLKFGNVSYGRLQCDIL